METLSAGSTPSDTTPPSTPTGLTGTPVAAGRIDLSWTASTDDVGVAGYNVYRDTAKVNTVPIGSTSYSDTGLTPGANHTYTVTAIDAAANESAASGSWSGAAGSGALTTTYTYDAENRLTQLAVDSNVLGTYAYDGAGNRWSKTVVGVKTQYFLDLASSLPQVLAEDDGTTISRYAYAAGAPLTLEQAMTSYWYLTDTLGSVRLVTDESGATPATYAYSAFGSTRTSTGSLPNEVRFTGERTDTESGLEFLRARTYDPSTGTFLQRDSWGISPTDSQSIDAYVYTSNNPVNAVDPSGHCSYADHYSGCQGSSSGGNDMSTAVYEAHKAAVDKAAAKAAPAPAPKKATGIDPGGVALAVLGAPLSFGGEAWSHSFGGLMNHPADFLHDRGFSFSATVGICADLYLGGGFGSIGGWGGQFGGGLCAEATTNGQLGIVGNPAGGFGPGNSGVRGGGDINLLLSNGADIGDQRGPFVGTGGAISGGWAGGDLNAMSGPNHCSSFAGGGITTDLTGGWAPGFGSKAGPGAQGALTTILWQSAPSAPCPAR